MRTELTVDGYRQLKEIRYPDGGTYSFEYMDDDGLLTAKIEPETNRFSHRFDIIGQLTDAEDEAERITSAPPKTSPKTTAIPQKPCAW